MPRSHLVRATAPALLAVGFVGSILGYLVLADEPAPQPEAVTAVDEAAIRAVLERRVSVNIKQMPLSQFAAAIERDCGIPVFVDKQNIEDEGGSLDAPLTLHVSGIQLKSALRLVLDPQQLRAVAWEGQLRITTAAMQDELMTLHTYDVSDLLAGETDSAMVLEELLGVVYENTGGPLGGFYSDPGEANPQLGSVRVARVGGATLLVIRQTPIVHEDIEQVLRDIRTALAARKPAHSPLESAPSRTLGPRRTTPVPAPAPDAAIKFIVDDGPGNDARVRAALDRLVSAKVDRVPLRQFTRQLERTFDVSVVLEEPALTDEGLTPDLPINLDTNQITLRSALELSLAPHQLTADVQDEVLFITTVAAHITSVCRVYDVTDLIRNRRDRHYAVRNIVQLIQDHTGGHPYGPTWQNVDGEGNPITRMSTDAADLVVINQTETVHRQIEALFAAIRAANEGGTVQTPERGRP